MVVMFRCTLLQMAYKSMILHSNIIINIMIINIERRRDRERGLERERGREQREYIRHNIIQLKYETMNYAKVHGRRLRADSRGRSPQSLRMGGLHMHPSPNISRRNVIGCV